MVAEGIEYRNGIIHYLDSFLDTLPVGFFSREVLAFLLKVRCLSNRTEKYKLRLKDKEVDKVESKGVKQQTGREKSDPGDLLFAPFINQS